MARRGVALWAIQWVGRWGGDSVRLYTAQAFADRRAALAIEAAEGRCVAGEAHRDVRDTELWELVEQVRETGRVKEDLGVASGVAEYIPQMATRAAEEVAEIATQTEQAEDGIVATNLATGLSHFVPRDWTDGAPVSAWKAECGWAFTSATNVKLGRGQPTPPVCKHCLRVRARTQPGGVHVPTSSSSG